MNASITKYAPKTKTYGMTISLTNRVLISVGIGNLTAERYWEQVYFSLGLSMATETTSFLKSQHTFRFYRKQYTARTDIKSKRAKDNNNKIIDLIILRKNRTEISNFKMKRSWERTVPYVIKKQLIKICLINNCSCIDVFTSYG